MPDLMKFFYGSIYNRVNTQDSFNFYFHGEAGTRRMQLASIRPSRARAQLKPSRLVQPVVRKAFPDTIYWVADMKTDSSGRAKAEVTFPDSMTTWRATARGVTENTEVGTGIARTIVRKNLILTLATPRFLTEDDEVVVPAIVRNYLDTAKTARVSLEVTGASIIQGSTRDVQVEPNGEAEVDFRLRAGGPGTVKLLGKALTDQESDALELTLPVRPFGSLVTESRTGSLSANGSTAGTTLTFPADARRQSRYVEIRLSPSLVGPLFGALDYLTSYPYGCTEQTMSSFLPDVIVSHAASSLDLRATIDEQKLDKQIRAGLDRLYSFQHQDGGWGWWRDDESSPFMTAYVVSGLRQAGQADVRVRGGVIPRGESWLRKRLDSEAEQKDDADLRAYMVYALSLGQSAVDQARIERLFQQRASLQPLGQSLLGLAILQSDSARKDEMAESVAAALEASVTREGGMAYWKSTRDALLDISADATPEATAYAVKFLSAVHPSSTLLDAGTVYLLRNRKNGYYWNSTKQTAMVIYGLIDMVKRSGELRPDFTAEVSVNGKVVATRRFGSSDAMRADGEPIRVSADALGAGDARVQVNFRGEGRLYWSAAAPTTRSIPDRLRNRIATCV